MHFVPPSVSLDSTLTMDDCGTDAEALASNLAFIYYGMSDNGVRSIDNDFEISQGVEGLEINGYDPQVKDDSSDVRKKLLPSSSLIWLALYESIFESMLQPHQFSKLFPIFRMITMTWN